MKRRTDQIASSGRLGHAALWGGAGLVVLVAHAGAIAWMLREPPMAAAESAPPAAVMIELAPEPEAVDTSETAISPDQTETEEVVSEATEPVEEPTPPEPEIVPEEAPPEPVPELLEEEVAETPPPEPTPREVVEPEPPEVAQPAPPEEVVEPEPIEEVDPLQQEMLARLEGVVIPTPAARPKPPERAKPPERRIAKAEPRKEPVKETTRRKPKREAPAPATRATQKAKAAEARPSTRTAARQSSSGYATASISPAKWQSRLMSHLERRKRYPNGALSRGQSAIAHVRFRIDEAGNVLSASLARSSGVPELDSEVVALVRRASPVPPPPPGTNRTITAPVRFRAR